MRLIDADALLEREQVNPFVKMARGCGKTLFNACKIYLNVVVSDAPTIDAVPVVRCKDCKWYTPDTDCGFDESTGRRDHSKIVKKPYGECHGQNFDFTEDGFLRVGDDDFCSCGERKDT